MKVLLRKYGRDERPGSQKDVVKNDVPTTKSAKCSIIHRYRQGHAWLAQKCRAEELELHTNTLSTLGKKYDLERIPSVTANIFVKTSQDVVEEKKKKETLSGDKLSVTEGVRYNKNIQISNFLPEISYIFLQMDPIFLLKISKYIL